MLNQAPEATEGTIWAWISRETNWKSRAVEIGGKEGVRGGRGGGVAAFHNSFLIMIIMMMTRLGLARMRHAKLLVVVAPGQDQSCECHTVSLMPS